ncbi:MAG: SRPBCC family protein [Myxococcota bacterium]
MLAKSVLILAACSVALAAPDAPPTEATPPVGAAPCIACRAPVAEPAALYSLEDWAALQEGAVLRQPVVLEVEPDDTSGATRAESLIRRPPANVWTVLTDFERWPEFMPLIDATRVDRRVGAKLWVEQRYSIMLMPFGHTTIYELDPRDGRLTWNLDEAAPHDIAASVGAWALLPLGAGDETLVRYDARMRAGRALPEFVERMLRDRSLEQMLAGLRAEVLRRFPEN